ncbi:MAG: AMP-binding protein [Clostridiales bacterium]|nr:AMP-binding protein [Clostridiales bacterium]
MKQTTGLEFKLQEMAGRIKELRLIENISREDMALKTGVSLEEYVMCEEGRSDLNFAFIYRCALVLGVDVTDIIEGTSPRLSNYTVTRNGEGQRIEQAHGMIYYNLAAQFKNRIAEPLYVNAAYSEEAQYRDIELTSHAGQECDIIIKGKLKVQVGTHWEILSEGDSIYYDSATPHGMIAVGGEDCLFYAIVLNPSGEPVPELSAKTETALAQAEVKTLPKEETDSARIWAKYIDVDENEDGSLKSISYKNTEHFNFAFDVVDVLAKAKPDKLALLHVSHDKVETRFTFSDISRLSNRAANYFTSLGIKKGDRVLMMLRRHYQFWIAMMALNKIGAVGVLAANQLLEKDLTYRFNTAGVSAVMCTSLGSCADEVEKACALSPTVKLKIMVDGTREGWHDFDSEFRMFRSTYVSQNGQRPEGDDLLFMVFTSGTTGYPKIATHCHKYPLGHFVTARYWQQTSENGLHLTISDTGWAKSMWGKLYGQWLNECAVFVYDFDRFDASDILPMFAKYGITSFCAPPTMYRFMIKQDLSNFDLSGIRHAAIAGEALNPEVFNRFKESTGLSVMEGFGQSETTVMIANLRGMQPKIGSMGKPVPGYDVDLVDSQGKSVQVGEVGEIVIRVDKAWPYGLFSGYYDKEKGMPAIDTSDGYYHTGDTAWRDEDGYFWYVGRVDDVIKSSGYRIGPFEIENVIMELPYVLECGVSPKPDPVRGQVVKASIVLTKGTEGTEELKKEIQNYVKQRTAPYKYPRIVVFRDELPKTTSGKIIRKQL